MGGAGQSPVLGGDLSKLRTQTFTKSLIIRLIIGFGKIKLCKNALQNIRKPLVLHLKQLVRMVGQMNCFVSWNAKTSSQQIFPFSSTNWDTYSNLLTLPKYQFFATITHLQPKISHLQQRKTSLSGNHSKTVGCVYLWFYDTNCVIYGNIAAYLLFLN